MNPCIDCRIYMHKKAAEFMREIDADFIITGDVLGQRPMSQRRDALNIIDRDSDLKGKVLRPLSAKVLNPTIVEESGLVDRNQLLKITGRGRKPQISLAEEYNIHDYPCPAGGCLLTDPGFSRRLRDLFKHYPGAEFRDIQLLKIGRHHRLSHEAKLVVGRNQSENLRLENHAGKLDILLQPVEIPGPTALLHIEKQYTANEKILEISARIVLYYCNLRNVSNAIVKIDSSEHDQTEIDTHPVSNDFIEKIRL